MPAKKNRTRMSMAREDADEVVYEPTRDEGLDNGEPLSDNAHEIPLFAHSDGRTGKSIAILKLYKLEQHGFAYKGIIPSNATQDSIGMQFGDGVYNIEACNRHHRVLDTLENIRISLGSKLLTAGAPSAAGAPAGPADLDRIQELSLRASENMNENNRAFVQMVITQTEAAAQRERDFMAGQATAMANFFQAMQVQSQNGFTQLMALMQTSHTQTIQQITAARENTTPPTDVKELMALLMQGIGMGRELAGGAAEDDEEEMPLWQQIMGGGMGLLKSVADAKAAAATQVPPGLPNPAPTSRRKLTDEQRAELSQAVKLVQFVRSSGLTVEQLAERIGNPQPSAASSNSLSDPENGEHDDEDEEVEDDSEDSEPDDDELESDDSESEGFERAS